MTVFVETDFLLAIAEDDDWLQERAEHVLDEHEIVTSPFTYLEMLIVLEQHQFDYVRLFADLLDLVPVGSEDEKQVVLKAVAYFEGGMAPFDSFHAATAETRGLPILSSDKAYEGTDPDRIPPEPIDEEQRPGDEEPLTTTPPANSRVFLGVCWRAVGVRSDVDRIPSRRSDSDYGESFRRLSRTTPVQQLS